MATTTQSITYRLTMSDRGSGPLCQEHVCCGPSEIERVAREWGEAGLQDAADESGRAVSVMVHWAREAPHGDIGPAETGSMRVSVEPSATRR